MKKNEFKVFKKHLNYLSSHGEAKLAFKLIVNNYKTSMLLKNKLRHNRRWEKLMGETEELHNEVKIATFKIQLERI